MRYFFHIAYSGANYSGWQKHPDGRSVQQVLELSLSQIFKKEVWIVGCGRTDTRVNASQFFFHLDTAETWDYDLLFRLNKLLPNDIAVFEIISVNDKAHARFDAVERCYNYFIHTKKDPFLSSISSYYPLKDLDIDEMNKASKLLLNYTDYTAFCKTPAKNTHSICNITQAAIFVNNAGDRLRFHISANRFLGKMVRIIVGKLIDIGTGSLSIAEFEAALINPQLIQKVKPAYPQGLYLSKVAYPFLNLPERTDFIDLLMSGDWKP